MTAPILLPPPGDRARAAVVHLVEHSALRWDCRVEGDRVVAPATYPLSPGQATLWRLARSIAGTDTASLFAVAWQADDESRQAAAEAVALLMGVTP